MTKETKKDGQNSVTPKITAFPALAEIKERAANWLVRIDSGDFSAADQQALEDWVAADTLHRDTLLKLARQWDSMAILSNLHELFPLSIKEAEKKQGRASGNTNSWLGGRIRGGLNSLGTAFLSFSIPARSALTVSFVFLLTVVSVPGFRDALFNLGVPQYETAVGERSTFTLSDGSTVTLNTNSELRVHYSDTRREVRLTRGEANFKVAKNTGKPFVVRAGDGLVWAVGTAFNVRYANPLTRKNGEAVKVMVTEGTVKVFTDIGRVSSAKLKARLRVDQQELQQAQIKEEGSLPKQFVENNRESLLTEGQALRYSEVIDTKEMVAPDEMEKQLAWHNGVIIFDGETLEQALLEVSRYTEKELRIVDPEIRHIPVGGHYKTNNIDALLASLSDGFGIKVIAVGDNRIHLVARD